MKKYHLIFSALAVAGLFVFVPAFAQDENGRGKDLSEERKAFTEQLKEERKAFIEETQGTAKLAREEFRAELEARREAFRAELETKREAFKAELEAKKEAFKAASAEEQSQWRGRAQLMVGNRFEMAIRNLERIQGRVAAIIEGMDEGEDTSAAEEALALSESKLAEAVEKIDAIKLIVDGVEDKITVEEFEDIKLLAREAKDLLKEARLALVQAIKEIKGLGEEEGDEEEEDGDEEENVED